MSTLQLFSNSTREQFTSTSITTATYYCPSWWRQVVMVVPAKIIENASQNRSSYFYRLPWLGKFRLVPLALVGQAV